VRIWGGIVATKFTFCPFRLFRYRQVPKPPCSSQISISKGSAGGYVAITDAPESNLKDMSLVVCCVAPDETSAVEVALCKKEAYVVKLGEYTYLTLVPHATVCRAGYTPYACACRLRSLECGKLVWPAPPVEVVEDEPRAVVGTTVVGSTRRVLPRPVDCGYLVHA